MNEKITSRERLLTHKDSEDDYKKRNRMGCLEAWYDPYFAICHTFSKEEIEKMSDDEIEDLLTLAETIGEGLW